jgi:hypothetical protein
MMPNFKQQFEIIAYWGPRADSPEAMARRFLDTLDALSKINQAFGNWYVGRMKGRPLAPLSFAEVVEYVAEGVSRDSDGKTAPPEPVYGYRFGATTGLMRTPRSFDLSFHAGCTLSSNYLINDASIRTQPPSEENASLVTLAVLKPALLVLASLWQATWCGLGPWTLNDFKPKRVPHRPWFGLEWVTYLSPRFAPMVTPPASAITERLPDGALLMIATADRFSADNSRHLAVARDIEAALAPVNALPWPIDGEPATRR